MANRICKFCASDISGLRSNARICGSEECRKADARQRARAWHVRHGGTPARKAAQAQAARAWYERQREDPDALAKRREAIRAWREANAEAIREWERLYRVRNARRIAEKNRTRRARLLDAFVENVDVEALWREARGLCGICAEPIDPSIEWPDPMSLTLDHIVPLSRGGEHSYENAQPAHAACNSRKGSALPA